MTRTSIHFLVDESFEVRRFAETSFDKITGMDICFFEQETSFLVTVRAC